MSLIVNDRADLAQYASSKLFLTGRQRVSLRFTARSRHQRASLGIHFIHLKCIVPFYFYLSSLVLCLFFFCYFSDRFEFVSFADLCLYDADYMPSMRSSLVSRAVCTIEVAVFNCFPTPPSFPTRRCNKLIFDFLEIDNAIHICMLVRKIVGGR